MSSDYNRANIDPQENRGRLRKTFDTLQEAFSQTVETVTRQARFEISGGGVDTIDAPDNLDELVDEAKKVGFVWRAFDIFANEVWEPGVRFEGPDETLAFLLGDQEDLDASPPEETPEGGFLENCGVYAGVKQNDFYHIGKQATFQRRLRGTVLVELLKNDSETPIPETKITGFNFVRPETVSAETYPYSNILIEPEDTDIDGVDITKRGEAAAYIQWEDSSILGRVRGGLDNEEIPLSQNDLKKQVLNPGIGDDASEEQGVFGTSEIQPIAEDIAEYRQIKRDRATAIQNKAHGIHLIEHGRDVLDYGNGEIEIIEWDDDSMDNFEDDLSNLEPGGYVTYDASVNVERKTGDVPDLVDTLNQIINDIFAGLPVPKYKVGFSGDINRDVTSEQSDDSEKLVSEEREYQERWWTEQFKLVADSWDLPTEGLQLKIAPEPEDSPVLSLSSEEIDKLNTYAQALNTLAGPRGGPETLVDTETLLTDVAQLPESVQEVDEIEPENTENPDAMGEFLDAMGGDETNTDPFEQRLEQVESRLDALFDPVKHPRNPETGKFVERPYDVPDEISGLDTGQIIGELAAANEDFEEQVEGIAVDIPGSDEESAVPTELQELIDSPDAGSGESVEGIEPINDFDAINEGDTVRVNGRAFRVDTAEISEGGFGAEEPKLEGEYLDTGERRRLTFEAGKIQTAEAVAEGTTTFGDNTGEAAEIRRVVETQYGPKLKIDSPFAAKDAIKSLDFDETHRSWNSNSETWDIDVGALDEAVETLNEEGFNVQVSNDLLALEEVPQPS